MEIENDRWFKGEEAQVKQKEFESKIRKEQHKIEKFFPKDFTFKEEIVKHNGNDYISALICFDLTVFDKQNKAVAGIRYSIGWWFPQDKVAEEWLDMKTGIENKFLFCYDDLYLDILKVFGNNNKYDKLLRK